MSGILLIRDLAVVLLVGGMAAWICQRIGLSAVVGYLVAGAVIGPYTPPFALVSDLDRIQTLAQLGLVFLIFSIGLNLGLSRLKRLGLSTLVATFISAAVVLSGCRLFGLALGWSTTVSLFFAGMLMVSSSAIISKVLDELNMAHERPGQLALAVTVFEDIIAITMLTVLSSITRFGGNTPPPLLPSLGALGAFIVLLLLLSLLVIPKLLRRLAVDGEPENRTLVVGGTLLALSWLAVQMGYSLALGAFIFGIIVGSTRYKSDIERNFEGLRQIFGAVFFVAVGMLVNFRLLLTAWPLMLALTALALVLRPLACSLGFLAVGNSRREAIQAGLSLAPLGEFTFVIAQLGVESGVLPQSSYPVAAGAALLTALAAPVLTRHSESLSRRLVAEAEPGLLRRWESTYLGLLAKLRARQTTGILWKLTRKRLLHTGMHMVLVSALLLFIRPLYQAAREGLDADSPFQQLFPFAFWSLFGLLLLGPLIAIWRNISALNLIVAEAATTGTQKQAVSRLFLERLLNVAGLILLSLWLLSVLPSGWSLFGPGGGVLLLLLLVAAVFWPRFVKLHTRFEMELIEQLHRASQVTSASSWSDTLPQRTADWDVEIEEVTISADSRHIGRTLHQLALRANYGVSVLGIDRQGVSIVNPGAATVLYPYDKLLLLGGHTAVVRAKSELMALTDRSEAGTGFDELTMESVQVPEGSPLAGKTLVELDLIGNYGVQLGGIRRGTQRHVSPNGKDRFYAGDELLVLGTGSQIRDFRTALSNAEPQGQDRL